jgi:hypothetical protein
MLPLILSLLLAPASQGADKLTTVRAYVFTDTAASGQPDEDEKGRLDAVRELKDALRKKKGISIVDDRAEATLLIEVTGREQKEDVQGPFGGKAITSLGDTIIRFHVSSGGHESDLKGMGQGTFGRAAKDAADRILLWISRREPPRQP